MQAVRKVENIISLTTFPTSSRAPSLNRSLREMLLGGGVREFSRLLFPPSATVERLTTAPKATGDKYMMVITNLDVDVDVNGKAMASTELW